MSESPVKINTIANYFGRFYITIIGLVVYPLYLKYLGAEAYGLVGFFVVFHTWFLLLDAGMSPMLARQAAITQGKKGKEFDTFRQFLRSIELIFLVVFLTIAALVFAGSTWIADNWFQAQDLNVETISCCIALMGMMSGFRCFSGLYASGINGFEKQVWINGARIIIATLRFVGALIIMRWVSTDIVLFFLYQLFVAVLEFLLYGRKLYNFLPAATQRIGLNISYETLKPSLSFGMSVAFLTIIGTAAGQIDKLLLSNALSLKEYGYFTLVAVVANSVTQMASPVNNALMPRMTNLLEHGLEAEMISLYRKATQFICVVILSITGTVAIFSYELLYSWSGDQVAAKWAAPILFWYVLGAGLSPITIIQYFIQYAHGKLDLQIKMTGALLIFSLPCMFIAAYKFGALGTGITGFLLHIGAFFIWPAITHMKYIPGFHLKWLKEDILPICLMNGATLIFVSLIPISLETLSRIEIFIVLMFYGGIVLCLTALGSSYFRTQILKYRFLRLVN